MRQRQHALSSSPLARACPPRICSPLDTAEVEGLLRLARALHAYIVRSEATLISAMSAAGGIPPSLVKLAEAIKPTNEYMMAWSALYMLTRFVVFRKCSADFANRIVSILHALVAIVLSYLAIDQKDPFGNIGGANTAAQVHSCS